MITKTVANVALAAALAVGILGTHGTAFAGEWGDAVSAAAKTVGFSQMADHSTDWAKALRVENVVGPVQTATSGGFGFLEQARAQG